MKYLVRTAAAALALGLAAAQSDLPPGILLLARVKAHIREELARLPNCSCLETVTRDYKGAREKKLSPLDVVRLEVLYSGGREMYAAPGERHFTSDRPGEFVGSGTIADGYFAIFLTEISSDGRASYEYKGDEEVNGRRAARYDYRIPVTMSGHQLNFAEGSGIAGVAGTFWADPVTFDVVRLESNATEIPSNLPVAELSHTVEYGRATLGDATFLLPVRATMRLNKTSGEESVNRIEFSRCHLYSAESSINFGMQEAVPKFSASATPESELEPLPELEMVLRLTTPITPQTSVGAAIEAVVAGNAPRKGAVVIPDGAIARGRLRRMEWYSDHGGYYVVGIDFTEIEAAGRRYRLDGELIAADSKAGVVFELVTEAVHGTARSSEVLTLPRLPGVGVFFVRGRKMVLPKGFRTEWRTHAER